MPLPATRAEVVLLPATRAEVTLPPPAVLGPPAVLSPPAVLGPPAVLSPPTAPGAPIAPRTAAQAAPVGAAPVSAAPVASVPAAIRISPSGNADPAVTQPSRTVSVRWKPASLAGRPPGIVRVVVTATVAAIMFAIGAIIMLLLRRG
jgi:fused signal recognition particle receptor